MGKLLSGTPGWTSRQRRGDTNQWLKRTVPLTMYQELTEIGYSKVTIELIKI